MSTEGQRFSVSRPAHARFGTPRQWLYKDVSGGVTCDAAFFNGDPNPGVFKTCELDDPSIKSNWIDLMLIGDSITGFYQEYLYRAIAAAGYVSVNFAGNGPITYRGSADPLVNSNGYGGYIARNLLLPAGIGTHSVPGLYNGDSGDLTVWLRGQHPDIVLLHLGTNDGSDVQSVLAAYRVTLDAVRAKNPMVKVFVALIIPSTPSPEWSASLDAAIPAWVASNTTLISPITVVDQHTGFDSTTMTVDGTHPNATGATQMAGRWLSAIRTLLR